MCESVCERVGEERGEGEWDSETGSNFTKQGIPTVEY